jgi:2-iminoacetate synthase
MINWYAERLKEGDLSNYEDYFLINEIINRVNGHNRLRLNEARSIISISERNKGNIYENLIKLSREIKYSIFKGNIYAIAPLYVSSICQENCLYCNFRSGNKKSYFKRIRLSDKELEKEIEYLANKGIRVIELVFASDPAITASEVSKYIRIAKNTLSKYDGGEVGINARPYSEEEYGRFKESGLTFVVLWQETYDIENYKRIHPGNTEKTDFFYRLNAPERMINAGIGNIGLGIQLGLSDWKKDWIYLMYHIDYLINKYGKKIENIILGIPRLKAVQGAIIKRTVFVPSDIEYLFGISLFNLYLPSALPFVNTRECWNLCLEVARGGGTLFTFNCKTIPGGYTLGQKGFQFPTHNYDVGKYAKKLRDTGLNPILNWKFNSDLCRYRAFDEKEI